MMNDDVMIMDNAFFVMIMDGSCCTPSFKSIILQVPGMMLCMLGMRELPFVGLGGPGKKAAFASPASLG